MFITAKERKGGSEYLELQICTSNRIIDSKEMANIEHWANSSIYVHGDDLDEFYHTYCSTYFQKGLHMNGQREDFDPYGINYFSSFEAKEILEKVEKDRPSEFEMLTNFLKISEQNNGFYILGL